MGRFPLLLLLATSMVLHGDDVVDGVVAVVDGTAITLSDLDREIVLQMQQIPTDVAKLAVVRGEVLQRMIERILVLGEAKHFDIVLEREDEEEVSALVDRDVAEHNNLAQFLEDLRAIGYDEREYRQRIRDQVLSQKITARALADQPFVAPADLRQYYEEHQADYRLDELTVVRHVMVSTKKWTTEEARERIDQVSELLASGRSLAALVEEYSDGPHASTEGIWELKSPDDFIDPLGEVVFGLEEGQVSGVLESHLGFHIVEVVRRRASRLLPFSDVQKEIEANLRRERFQQAYKSWIEKIRARAFIRIYFGSNE